MKESKGWTQEELDSMAIGATLGDLNYEWELPDELPACEKPHHIARSCFHSPNHLKHIKSLPAIPMRIPENQKKHIKKSGKK